MIRDSAHEFLTAQAPIGHARSMRDRGVVFDAGLWERMVELGWSAMLIDADRGGFGLGLSELVPICEQLGIGLTPSPLLSVVLSAHVLAGDAESLAAIAEGAVIALADHEPMWRRGAKRTAAVPVVGGWRLTGVKSAVQDAAASSAFLVTATDPAGQPVLVRVDGDNSPAAIR